MKIYKRKNGLNVVSGKVTKIEPAQNGAKKITVEIEEYDSKEKTYSKSEVNLTSSGVSDGVMVGSIVTGAGYLWGAGNIMSNYVSDVATVMGIDDVEIISGEVQKAVFKNELNEDGTAKLKRDGTPRKPHYDISVVVPDEEGHKVIHIVKIYNYNKLENGQISNIDKMKRRFADFKDKDSTPTNVTIVTNPGMVRTWDSEFNGRQYVNYVCDHLGIYSLDINPLYEKERTMEESPNKEELPTSDTMPFNNNPIVQPSAPTQSYVAQAPVTQAPEQPIFGGIPAPEIEDEDYFN